MAKLSLDGAWQLAQCPDGDGKLEALDTLAWIAAEVPGEVHLDLMRAGRIPDPYYDLNHQQMREMENDEFWYRRSFDVPADFVGEKLELTFEALDCFATVWLNGQMAGESSNALVPRKFEVTGLIKPGANEIVVRLASPLKSVEGLDITGCQSWTPERLWARKPDQQYGWDISLRLVTVGLERSVTLASYSRAILRDFFFRTESIASDGKSAEVKLDVEVEELSAPFEALKVSAIAACGESTFTMSGQVDADGVVKLSAKVADPKLWWTWDLGEPNLYDLTIVLYEGEQEIARCEKQVGIRIVKLVEEPEGGDSGFVFELNGTKFFARGLNWTPCDGIYPRAEPWKQQRLVQFSRAMNVNMLRIWGGGIYEPDAFYEECDRQGITVFHDFLYGCAVYPQTPEFLDIARDEAEAAVRRLRNHACLALWSGDNEVDCSYRWGGDHGDPWEKNKITRQVLPEVVARLDGTRKYIPSSPYSPDHAVDPNDVNQGDAHIWYHGTPFWADVYLKSPARFASEIGHLSCPDLQTVVDMLAPQNRWPSDNQGWDEHFGDLWSINIHYNRRKRMDASLAAWLGEIPSDLGTYVIASQLIQGEAYKAWAEHFRLQKAGWQTGGILLWNLADNWPQFSDAIVDFWMRPKLACNYVQWAYQVIHICFSEVTAEEVAVFAINDTAEEIEAEWVVTAFANGGASMGQVSGTTKVGANEVVKLAEVRDLYRKARSAHGKVVAEMKVGGKQVARNVRILWKPTVENVTRLLEDLPALQGQP